MTTFTSAQLAKAQAQFTNTGTTVMDFAREHGLDYWATVNLLQGRSKGSRGKCFQSAVALGLRKAPPKKRSRATPAAQRVAV